ncbi:MAG: Dihydroneopterin aldolase [Anaerolineales bacterium]|nr:Dihydroneopterin aldolase [Anaerolineales bacterium]
MDKIFIKDLLARGIIGVREWERKKPQDILINVTVFADTIRAGETDDVADSVDYSALAKILQTHAESAARLTVEALASDLAKLCLELPGVKKVIVRVEKPGAVKFTKSVGVEIERVRSATVPRRG